MTYYLSLGSNLGNREETLRQALQLIEQQIGTILRCSSFYYSEPWGFTSENDFCNLCCAVESNKQPLDVLFRTQDIERALGRKKKTISPAPTTNSPSPLYSDRPIDIDLIRAFDDEGNEIKVQIANDQSQMSGSASLLTLPHPLWQERDFVKVPLAEIMH